MLFPSPIIPIYIRRCITYFHSFHIFFSLLFRLLFFRFSCIFILFSIGPKNFMAPFKLLSFGPFLPLAFFFFFLFAVSHAWNTFSFTSFHGFLLHCLCPWLLGAVYYCWFWCCFGCCYYYQFVYAVWSWVCTVRCALIPYVYYRSKCFQVPKKNKIKKVGQQSCCQWYKTKTI